MSTFNVQEERAGGGTHALSADSKTIYTAGRAQRSSRPLQKGWWWEVEGWPCVFRRFSTRTTGPPRLPPAPCTLALRFQMDGGLAGDDEVTFLTGRRSAHTREGSNKKKAKKTCGLASSVSKQQ